MAEKPQQDTRLRKTARWGGYGAGVGAAGYGLLAASKLRGTGWHGAGIAGTSALIGAMRGGLAGGALGAITYRKKKAQELSSILDAIINFESITYHETEAERHQRKARVHSEKSEAAAKLGGYATAGGIAATTIPQVRSLGHKAVVNTGIKIVESFPNTIKRGVGGAPEFSGIGKVGAFIAGHPKAIWKGAAFAPAAALLGGYAAHKMGNWRQTKKANVEYGKANEARKKRNSIAQGKTELSVPINFEYDYAGGAEKLQEHAKKEASKTALELLYEKMLKGEHPRVKLSSRLDNLISLAADPRPRDLQGQFEPHGEGGPDPNAMARVYKQPQQQSGGMSLPKAAGAALAGGALGAVGGEAGKAAWKKTAKMVKDLAAKRKSSLIH